MKTRQKRVWLFDLDDTLHDATNASIGHTVEAMSAYMVEHLAIDREQASELRHDYWRRYGATLLGLVRHHAVDARHFLEQTHLLPGLEARLRCNVHDRAALRKLAGRKFILTNAPRGYAMRVIDALGLRSCFDGILCIEDMTMFGHHRPKPDARMLRHVAARLKVPTSRCILVEDTLMHQRSARRLHMRTVWMQRWLSPSTVAHRPLKPAYVDRRTHSFRRLGSMFPAR